MDKHNCNDSRKTNCKNNEASVLNSIYRGAATGSQSICDLLPKTDNPQFRTELNAQEQQYEAIKVAAAAKLKAMGVEPEPVGLMKQAGMKAVSGMHTMLNSDTSHLAELMINGSNMGITNMTKILNGYPNPQPDIKHLADRLIQVEKDNIERLKNYLQ